jgi:mono/diheme cytochrome c family protein
MRSMILALAAALSLAACAAQPETPEQSALIEDGREIAEAQCAACHAVGHYGESPNPQAPVFRTVLSRYSAEVLEE